MKRAPIGELPGIDGSASMLLPLFRNPAIAAIMPNQTREAGRLQLGDDWLALVTRKQSQILFCGMVDSQVVVGTSNDYQCTVYRSAAAQPMQKGATAAGSVRLAILMLACFAREMDVFCSPRKDGKRGVL